MTDQEDTMKTIAKVTIAALVGAAIGVVAVQTTHAQAKFGVDAVRGIDATGATRAQAYADWQGALTQSFGARFLAHGAPTEAFASAASRPTMHVFEGMEKMQVRR
jgi:hypothetical protein